MSILTLGSKKKEKENFQSKRKQKRREGKFPIKEWEKVKKKKRKKKEGKKVGSSSVFYARGIFKCVLLKNVLGFLVGTGDWACPALWSNFKKVFSKNNDRIKPFIKEK